MRVLGVVAAAGLTLIAAFQAAIAFGAPFGRAAWGGSSTHVPPRLRVASGVVAVVWLFAAFVVLERAGDDVPAVSLGVARVGAWVVAGVLILGTLVNLASRSRLERAIWAPTSLVLAILTTIVAIGDGPSG